MKKIMLLVSAVMLSGCVSAVTEQSDSELCFNAGRADTATTRTVYLEEMKERQDAGMFELTPDECKKQLKRGLIARRDSIIPAWTIMHHIN